MEKGELSCWPNQASSLSGLIHVLKVKTKEKPNSYYYFFGVWGRGVDQCNHVKY